VAVIYLFHLLDCIEPTNEVRGPEWLPRLYFAAMQFLDNANLAALMTPRHRDGARFEGHPDQPRTRHVLQFDLVTPNHPLRNLACLAHIEIALIWPEILGKGLGRNLSVLAQIQLREIVAFLVPQVAWDHHTKADRGHPLLQSPNSAITASSAA
jgi:hypothetical protein